MSAIENSARKTKFSDFDLAVVCAQLLDFYEPLAESKGLTMIAKADKPVPIRGDQDLMREALSNLIDNAIKFTPAGGAVRIEARMCDGRPFVRVSDTGVGVPPHERTRIFDRFYRGQQSGKSPGHGLGLSIAETIATSARVQTDGRRQQPWRALRIERHGVDASAGKAGAGSGLRRSLRGRPRQDEKIYFNIIRGADG